MTAFEEFCPEGKCAQEAAAVPAGNVAGQTVAGLNMALEDEGTRKIVSSLADDLSNVFNADFSAL